MTDLRPEVADLGPRKANLRPGKAELKSEVADLRTGKANLRLDYEGGDYDRKQNRIAVWNHRSSTPPGPLPPPQKKRHIR